jgi:hypothetical protein
VRVDDALDLVDFADDPQTFEALVNAAGTQNWSYELHRAKDKRHRRDEMARLLSELADKGLRVIETPDGWPYESPIKRINHYLGADGRYLDEERHANCLHRAFVVENYYGDVRAVEVCIDPQAAGHAVPSHLGASTSPEANANAKEYRRQREEQQLARAAISALRRDFVVGLSLKPDATVRALLRIDLVHRIAEWCKDWKTGIADIERVCQVLKVKMVEAPQKSRGTEAQRRRDLEAAKSTSEALVKALPQATTDQCLRVRSL